MNQNSRNEKLDQFESSKIVIKLKSLQLSACRLLLAWLLGVSSYRSSVKNSESNFRCNFSCNSRPRDFIKLAKFSHSADFFSTHSLCLDLPAKKSCEFSNYFCSRPALSWYFPSTHFEKHFGIKNWLQTINRSLAVNKTFINSLRARQCVDPWSEKPEVGQKRSTRRWWIRSLLVHNKFKSLGKLVPKVWPQPELPWPRSSRNGPFEAFTKVPFVSVWMSSSQSSNRKTGNGLHSQPRA